jgi:hypothetical protein
MCDRERTVCMSGCSPLGSEPAPHACAFYRRALLALQAAQVPFLVGGGYALAHYVSKIADAAAHCCATLLAYSRHRRGRTGGLSWPCPPRDPRRPHYRRDSGLQCRCAASPQGISRPPTVSPGGDSGNAAIGGESHAALTGSRETGSTGHTDS